jgi:hypothetical protein
MFHLPSTKSTTIHLEGFERPAVEPTALPESVLVRRATGGDVSRIRTLALLDCRRIGEGPYLVAEIADEMLAAMSLTDGTVVADPFRRTREAVELLRMRAAQIAERERQLQARGSGRKLKLLPAG